MSNFYRFCRMRRGRHLAASAGHLEMVEALIQAGCDVGIQDFVSDQKVV